jgi:hypothetical protein
MLGLLRAIAAPNHKAKALYDASLLIIVPKSLRPRDLCSLKVKLSKISDGTFY